MDVSQDSLKKHCDSCVGQDNLTICESYVNQGSLKSTVISMQVGTIWNPLWFLCKSISTTWSPLRFIIPMQVMPDPFCVSAQRWSRGEDAEVDREAVSHAQEEAGRGDHHMPLGVTGVTQQATRGHGSGATSHQGSREWRDKPLGVTRVTWQAIRGHRSDVTSQQGSQEGRDKSLGVTGVTWQAIGGHRGDVTSHCGHRSDVTSH